MLTACSLPRVCLSVFVPDAKAEQCETVAARCPRRVQIHSARADARVPPLFLLFLGNRAGCDATRTSDKVIWVDV